MAAGSLPRDPGASLLAAIGGLVAVVVDAGGPYLARLKRVGSAAVFGGAVGLTIGAAIHGRGWIAVVVLVLVAGVSVVVSEMGSTGSVVGLQLLVFASLGLGPLGGLRPWWTGPLEFLIGVAWAMILIIGLDCLIPGRPSSTAWRMCTARCPLGCGPSAPIPSPRTGAR
jgi:uncharacterized membrane protein YccC